MRRDKSFMSGEWRERKGERKDKTYQAVYCQGIEILPRLIKPFNTHGPKHDCTY